jgi:aminoglycoside 3-N-acetyltransferase
MRNFIRKITPTFLLNWFRQYKKQKVRAEIERQAKSNKGWTKEDLKNQLKEIGIVEGDTVLVHSAMSKIGFLIGGQKTVVDALIETVGPKGHILMPNSPNARFQLDYIQEIESFDVSNDKSKLGAISEYFRNHKEAIRSWHPTEPVSCIGPDAEYFVGSHFNQITPYNEKSPFFRVAERNGKILMIGVTLDNAGTNLHTLEDAIEDFKYPIYHSTVFETNIIDPEGEVHSFKTKVHDPVWSKKRKCDGLIPLFEERNVLEFVKFGNAPTLLLDAKKMLDVMIEEYKKNGVTMYTPNGSKN